MRIPFLTIRLIFEATLAIQLFSIFTACCYFLDADNRVTCKSIAITCELPDHSRAAAITSVLKIIKHLRAYLPLKINAMIWSDGCSAQFRSRFLFKLPSTVDSSLSITWGYKERHPGKDPMDGIGGALTNCIYRDVMSGKYVTDTPQQLADHADKTITGTTSLYLPEEEVLVEPEDSSAKCSDLRHSLFMISKGKATSILKISIYPFYTLKTILKKQQ